MNATVVFYHYVRASDPSPFAGIQALAPRDFAAQLDWLQARFDIIDVADFEDAVRARRPLARPSALLTFDDGFVDHYEQVFPVLRDRGLGGIFYIVGSTLGPFASPAGSLGAGGRPRLLNVHKAHLLLGAIGPDALLAAVRAQVDVAVDVAAASPGRAGVYRYDERPEASVKRLLNYELPFDVADGVLDHLFRRHIGDPEAAARRLYLSPAMIREMVAGGMTFGFHTETHRVLSRLSGEEQRTELMAGVRLVRELTGQAAVSFCYPYGFPHTYTDDTIAILDEAGYSMAFNTVRRRARPEADARFELPRFDTRDVPPLGSVLEDLHA